MNKPPLVIASILALGVLPESPAQADLAYLRSLHSEANVRTYVERGYTNILVNPVSEAQFDAVRAKTVGGTFVDPNFGRQWTFVYAGGEKILNSERNAWNSDQSLIALTVASFTNYYDFALFDGATAAYLRTVRFNKPFTGVTTLRWMPNDPAKMFYFYGNKMYTWDVNTLAVAEYQTFASFTLSATDIAGGDGNDVAPNGDLLIGNKGPNCFVYNIPLKKVVRLSGGNRTYLEPTQAFTTINLGQIDYAVTFANHIVEQDEDSGGTLLRDLNGNVLQTLYKRTPHMDLTYFKDNGVLYPGINVVYNQADADHYNALGLPSVAGGGYFHGWNPSNPGQLVRFTMDTWTASTIASGGMYSANRYDGSTGIKSLDGPMLNNQPWQVRTGEVFEHAYSSGEATMPRRFAHHYIGYSATYTTSYQPEGWISPNGQFALIKVGTWGWYKVQLGTRMTKAEVDAYLNGPPAPTLPFSDNFEDGNASPWVSQSGTWSIVTDGTKVYRQTATTGDAVSAIPAGWTDQVVQARMKVLSFNGANRHASVYARYVDFDNHYYLALRSNNTVELKKKVAGTVTTLQVVPFTVATGTWYDVRLDAIGTTLRGYVNGTLLVTATDTSLGSGGAALGMFNASAQFDDVSITSTPPPTVLLFEDFEDNVANGFTTSGGSWSIVTDGTKVYRQASTTAADAWSFHSTSWTDQILEVDVKPISFNGTNRPVSVYVRWTDSNNHYYLALRSNNTLELKKKVGGTVTTLQSKTFTVSTGTWYTVKLEALGTTLKAYINGALEFTATDTSLTSGTVALGSYAASASFGDVLVTRP